VPTIEGGNTGDLIERAVADGGRDALDNTTLWTFVLIPFVLLGI